MNLKRFGEISMFIIIYSAFLLLGFVMGVVIATHYIVSTAIATISVMDVHVNANVESNFTINQTQLVEDIYRIKNTENGEIKNGS